MQLTASPEPKLVPAESPQRAAKERAPQGIFVFVFFLLLAALLIRLDSAPRPLGENAPPSEFSAARAVKHLAVISRAPHPINTAEHARVRDYIVDTLRKLGLDPQIQKTTDINEMFGVDGSLENVVARLKGSSREKAVLLVSHYDSVPFGPGASDDGAAVAALLETARALKSLPQLRRDVIFLFTDGEERGLLGARAFVSEHPWMNDIGLVLNFEARGIGGPSIMFETSTRNGWLIENFARAASHPVANSLSYEIYKRLPNNTDFTIFRRAGLSGLNFAYIDGLAYYHTAQDSVQNLDMGALQQHGDYVLEMTKQFGNASSDDPKLADVTYFDVLGLFLVRYSQGAGNVFLGFAAIVLVLVLYRGFRNGLLRIGAVLFGMVSMAVGCVIAMVCALIASRLVSATHSARVEQGLIYHSGWYILAFCGAGLACAAVFFTLVARRIGSASLIAGIFVDWLAATVAISVYLPGGTYLLLWPLLFSVLGWGLGLAKPESFLPGKNMLAVLGVAPAFLLIVPMAHKIFFAFAANSTLVVSGFGVLLLSLLLGQLGPEKMPKSWMTSCLLFLAAVGAFIAAITISTS